MHKVGHVAVAHGPLACSSRGFRTTFNPPFVFHDYSLETCLRIEIDVIVPVIENNPLERSIQRSSVVISGPLGAVSGKVVQQ